MAERWITKDGRRILLNDSEVSYGEATKKLEIPKYINTNAVCPVCNKRVAYYQNEFGSRVYFNDVGWPWEKHSCTSSGNDDTHAKALERLIVASTGRKLEALANGYLRGFYDDTDDSNSFALLRLKTSKAKVIYVECEYKANGVSWDVLHEAPFFLRNSDQAKDSHFSLWFFSSVCDAMQPTLRRIDVTRTSIPFDDCVRAFGRS